MPRIPPVTGKSGVAPEYQAVVAEVEGVFGNVRGPFSMLLHSPALAEHVLHLVRFVRENSIVDDRLRLLAILATVRERNAAYTWAAQVGAARREGVREAAIDVLRVKGDVAELLPEERDVVSYARQLARTDRVDQALFDTLQQRHGVQWLVEITTAVNAYALLSGIVNAFEVPPLPDGDRF